MAEFIQSLWESVFTPGPTPPLVLATNASFAALQAVLFALLLATHSVHFVVLSLLCGALWWSINWFVAELRASEEEQKRRAREEQTPRPEDYKGGDDARRKHGETGTRAISKATGLDVSSSPSLQDNRSAIDGDDRSMEGSAQLLPRPGSRAASEWSGVHVRGSSSEGGEVRKRGSEADMSTTDSEWEKVSDTGSGAPDTPGGRS